MAIHAVLWDLGGVLVRTESFERRAALTKRMGMSVGALSELVFGDESGHRAQLGEISAEEQWERVRVKLGLTPEELVAFQKEFFAGDQLDEELVDYIRALKQSHYTALLSNALDSLRRFVEEEWRIDDAFHQIIISAEVGLMKPDEAIYRLSLERLGVEAEEAVFIDDMLENVEGARHVGMQAIHFQSRRQARAELEALLDR